MHTDNYLLSLNDSQREAVKTTEGPVMVIAGAGSGKTRVLTCRIAHLMKTSIDSFHILALTFTNKAAKEMKERIEHMVGSSEAKNLWMGTFHSVFSRILRQESQLLGYTSNFTIYDTQDALNVITKIIKELQLDKDVYKPKSVLARISQYKNNLITVRSYLNRSDLQEADAHALRPKLGDIYRTYVDTCFKNNAMDFDDLLLKTNELISRFPDVLSRYQERFRYILVDEYQDTNHSQYLIVKALAGRYENICVVGDDAQSIYAFRGANIRNILNFENDYPDVKKIRLEQNYRSTKTIVHAANNIIAKNKQQLKKLVWTDNPTGERIRVYRALSDGEEARYIASSIFEKNFSESRDYRDFAILYRTNAQSRILEEALRKKNIPYKIYGGLSFYQRAEIKHVLAYFRLLVNPNDQEALLRIINYPKRGIGQVTINQLIVEARQTNLSIYEFIKKLAVHSSNMLPATAKRLLDFYNQIESYRLLQQSQNAFELGSYLIQTSGIMRQIKEDDTPEGISRHENIQELLNSIKGFVEEEEQLEEGDTSLAHFLEDVALITDLDKANNETTDHVSLMTVHLAKGLEYPVVMISGLEENLFPSMMSLNTRDDLEEERRLFYVALTRGQQEVLLSFASSRYRWGKLIDTEPSRFIDEIDTAHLDYPHTQQDVRHRHTNFLSSGANYTFKSIQKIDPMKIESNEKIDLIEGCTVEHTRFGKGVVQAIEGTMETGLKLVIDFQYIGVKKLLYNFAKDKIKRLS